MKDKPLSIIHFGMHFNGPKAERLKSLRKWSILHKNTLFHWMVQCFIAHDSRTYLTTESNKVAQLAWRESRFQDRLLCYERTFLIEIQRGLFLDKKQLLETIPIGKTLPHVYVLLNNYLRKVMDKIALLLIETDPGECFAPETFLFLSYIFLSQRLSNHRYNQLSVFPEAGPCPGQLGIAFTENLYWAYDTVIL